MTPHTFRKIYYYQTFKGLESLVHLLEQKPLSGNSLYVNVSSVHFGKINGITPYVHLNDNPLTSDKFHQVWSDCGHVLNKGGSGINLMIGGAGGAYQTLFSSFDIYYNLFLKQFHESGARNVITGFDLDIEESVSLPDVRYLIRRLRADFPSFRITTAPLLSSLTGDGSMSGFSYKKLIDSPEGKEIAWYHGQAYDDSDFSLNMYEKAVKWSGLSPGKILVGMMSQRPPLDWVVNVIRRLSEKYPDEFGGTFVWEYFNAPPGGEKNPSEWLSVMNSANHPKKNIP